MDTVPYLLLRLLLRIAVHGIYCFTLSTWQLTEENNYLFYKYIRSLVTSVIRAASLNKLRSIDKCCLLIVIRAFKNRMALRSSRTTLSHTAIRLKRLPFQYAPSKQGLVFRQFYSSPLYMMFMSELMFHCKNCWRQPPSPPPPSSSQCQALLKCSVLSCQSSV